MFTLISKRLDRVRGSGWLDCPNCHEHAAQDVVDRITFLAGMVGGIIVVPLIFAIIFFVSGTFPDWGWIILLVLVFYASSFRMAPIRRMRMLRCRRCAYEREAGAHALLGLRVAYHEEMLKLETMGEAIARAWLAPVGAISVGVVIFLFVVFIASSGNTGPHGLQYKNGSAAGIPEVAFDFPSSWNFNDNKDATPPFLSVGDTSGENFQIVLMRDDTTGNLGQLLTTHFRDQVGINDAGVPETPPKGMCADVGSAHGYSVSLTYQQAGQKALLLEYVFNHDGVGYVMTFTAVTDQGISDMRLIAAHVVKSVTFRGHETPAPTPSASPEASPTPAPTATPATAATGTPGPSASASPTPVSVSC